MTTDGGGWTLVVKAKRATTTLNYQNTAQWRDGTLLGDTSTLADENALGQGYNSVEFTDIMFQSISDTTKSLAWRHPNAMASMHAVVFACNRVVDGTLLFGTIGGLDVDGHSGSNMNHCTDSNCGSCGLEWGFFSYDSSSTRTVGGCSTASGYAGSVLGAGTHAGGSSCVSTFGVGSHYGGGTSGANGWSINYHWWGAGNWRMGSNVPFHSIGVFVR